MKKILIVEDESLVALEISNVVQTLGYNTCAIVSNAKKALQVVAVDTVDLILMDVYIKGDIDGIACAKEIKKSKDIPIIYISAFSDDDTLTRAIDTNPTSYLIKPFNIKELEIAIKIALKKSTTESGKENNIVGDFILDGDFSYESVSQELIVSGQKIHLTRQERQLLSILIRSKNQIVSIYEMENEIWPDKESNENTRRALIARLRSKLNYKFIETIHSVGYRINIYSHPKSN